LHVGQVDGLHILGLFVGWLGRLCSGFWYRVLCLDTGSDGVEDVLCCCAEVMYVDAVMMCSLVGVTGACLYGEENTEHKE